MPYGKLVPLPVPDRAWRHFSLDFITDLPPARTRAGPVTTAVLVVVDRFTKYVQYFLCTIEITAASVTDLLYHELVLRHGAPTSLVSDRDVRFTSIF